MVIVTASLIGWSTVDAVAVEQALRGRFAGRQPGDRGAQLLGGAVEDRGERAGDGRGAEAAAQLLRRASAPICVTAICACMSPRTSAGWRLLVRMRRSMSVAGAAGVARS